MSKMKQLVETYNAMVKDLDSEKFKPVKKFSTIKSGEQRIAKIKGNIKVEKPKPTNFTNIRHKSAPLQDPDIPTTRREALRKGYKMYWTGSACKYGHISVRYTVSGQCKKCYQNFRQDEIDYSEIDNDSLKGV